MKLFITTAFLFCAVLSKALTVADAGSDQTICESNLVYITPNSFPSANETAYWIDLDGFLLSPGDTIFDTAVESSLLNGDTKRLRYEITDGVTISSDEMTITGIGVPDVSNVVIAFPDGCEGTIVNVVPTGGIGVDEWIFEEISGAEVWQVSADRKSAEYKLSEEGASSATIRMYGVNSCGHSETITQTNTINLKPSQAPSITGDNVVCGSKSYTYNQPAIMPSDVTGYEWKWKGTSKGTVPSITLSGTDLVGNGKLELIPSNACGTGPVGDLEILVLVPIPAKIVLGFKDNKVEWCEDGALELEVNAVQSNGGTGATYEYFNGATSLGTSATVAQGSWKHGDQFTVRMTPDALTGCFIGGTAPVTSNVITIDGYKIPDVTLTANKAAICERDGNIALTIEGMKKGDYVVGWTKDNGSLQDGTVQALALNKAEERGAYEVTVANDVCAGEETGEINVMIYEQPIIETPSFLTAGRLNLQFDEKESPITDNLPIVTGLDLDQFESASYTWYSSQLAITQGSSDFEFTAQKGVLDTVSLVVTTGDESITCKDSISFVVKDAAAVGLNDKLLLEANMLYPNPARSTAFVQINHQLKGEAVEVYTLEGSLVYENKNATIIPTSGFTAGVYMVRIIKNKEVFASKLIVE